MCAVIALYPRPRIWRRHRGNFPPCLADWPQCLVNETVVFGQIGRALFHLQVTSNWRHAFFQTMKWGPVIFYVPRESSSAEIAAKLPLFILWHSSRLLYKKLCHWPIRIYFGSCITCIQWKPRIRSTWPAKYSRRHFCWSVLARFSKIWLYVRLCLCYCYSALCSTVIQTVGVGLQFVAG